MLEGTDKSAVRETARIAYREPECLSEREKESVLKTLIIAGSDEEAAAAERHLYFIEQAKEAQLTLKNILEGPRT